MTMSGPNTPHAHAQAQPKQMSSRLLTMKFMQRASSTNTRPTPNRATSTSQPHTPSSEPSQKRKKTDYTPDSSVPTTPATEQRAYVSRSDIKAAIQAEATFEALARAKRAELGFGHDEYESEWVLNVSIPNATNVNGQNDDERGSESEAETTGRQTYGGYKRRKKYTATTTSTPASKSGAQSHKFDDFDSDDDEEGSSDGELDSDEENETWISGGGYGSGKKRKANQIDEADETAMSALDRVDLSKTGYAKAKKATPGGGGSGGKKWGDLGKGMEQGGEKKGKWQGRGARGKKLGRKR